MLSNKPYLLRAFYQWIVDSHCTPILAINASHPNLKVPEEYIDGEEILFNISPEAVRDLKLSNDSIDFKASFSGVIHIITLPFRAALGVYAEENGEGIFFDADEMADEFPEHADRVVQLREIESSSDEVSDEHLSSRSSSSVVKPILKLVE